MPPKDEADAGVGLAGRELLFPIFLKLAGRLVVVVGGGRVGVRKAAAALAAGARVRLIDPAPAPVAVASLAQSPGLFHIQEPYRPDHLDGATLIFAAATPEVNASVVADARGRGLWVNAAAHPDAGDFLLPSVVRAGPFTIAASTSGAAPALARRVREKLEAEFNGAFALWVELLAEIRPRALAAVADETRRRELLDSFADWPWLERVRKEGVAAVRGAMLEMVREARLG